MANTVLIKWGTGELELDMPCFIDDMPDKFKCERIATLAKESDRDYGTSVVLELQRYCSDFIQNMDHIYTDNRATTKWKKQIKQFTDFLLEPLPQSKPQIVKPKSIRLF